MPQPSPTTQPSHQPDTQEWQAERQQWTMHFVRHLQDRLAWALTYLRQQQATMHLVAPHVDSLLALLDWAYRQPACHQAFLDLITALHPWPIRWGRWAAWERELRFAVQIAEQNAQLNRLPELLEDWAGLLHYMGRLDEALLACEQAMGAAEAVGDALYFVSAGGTAATTLKSLGRMTEGLALLQTLADHPLLAAREPNDLALAQLKLFQLDFQRSQGQVQAALESGATALVCLQRAPASDPPLWAWAHRNYGLALYANGDYGAATTHLEKARSLFHELGDQPSAALVNSNLGLIYWAIGNLAAAATVIQEGITVAQQLNAQWRVVKETGNLAIVYLLRGQVQQALSCVNQHLTLAERVAAASEINRAIGNRGIIQLHTGAYAAALQDLTDEITYLKALGGSREGLLVDYVNVSRCYHRLGDETQARFWANEAHNLAEAANADPLRMLALRCLAECQSIATEQIALLQRALTITQALGRRYDEAACRLALASVTVNPAERERQWSQGSAQLQETGAAAWLAGYSLHSPPQLPFML
jgi:tetratricopeptide (TPR) repeat protein